MPKDTRGKVTLSPDAYKALEVESMLMDVSLKEAASRMILKSACPKCKEILGIMARPPKSQKEEVIKGTVAQGPNDPITQETIDPGPDNMAMGQIAQSPDGTKEQKPKSKAAPKAKKKILAKDTEALAKIKELWGSGEHNRSEIARQVGYPKATVAENIKRMKERGELQLQEGIPQPDLTPKSRQETAQWMGNRSHL
jgi:hypothetical protein